MRRGIKIKLWRDSDSGIGATISWRGVVFYRSLKDYSQPMAEFRAYIRRFVDCYLWGGVDEDCKELPSSASGLYWVATNGDSWIPAYNRQGFVEACTHLRAAKERGFVDRWGRILRPFHFVDKQGVKYADDSLCVRRLIDGALSAQKPQAFVRLGGS